MEHVKEDEDMSRHRRGSVTREGAPLTCSSVPMHVRGNAHKGEMGGRRFSGEAKGAI